MSTHTLHSNAFALVFSMLVVASANSALAQVADDASLRAWADTTFYTGKPGGGKVTEIAPVLQADFKLLGLVRIGLDLPFAAAFTTLSSSISPAPSASRFTLGSPTLHGMLEVEAGPLLARAGLGVAVSVRSTDITSPDDVAGFTAMEFGLATRGAWNPWWYTDTHAIFAPGEVSYRGENYAFGVEGALMALIPRSDSNADTQTALQLGPYLAAVTGKTSAIGIRWRNVITFARGPLLDGDHAQSSLEAYAETRVMKLLLLGGGFLVNLDRPFGVFGSGGADVWALRVKAGLAL